MSSIDNLAKDLYKIIHDKEEKGPKPYEPVAKVVKVEDDVVWAKIPGSETETPVEKTVNAKVGDRVRLRVSGGRAWVLGNASNPPTDDTRANFAATVAHKADEKSEKALTEAESAKEAADTAWAYADSAHTAATNAWNWADDAHTAATNAYNEAERATGYANNALAGLGTLESVIDTVDWFATHKKASTDATVNPNKTYYIYDSVTGTLSKVEPEGTENPSQEGWYELDEAITNYVASHIAQTDDGLYVVGLANGWKILISSGGGNYTPGIYIIDPTGGISQATTANGITFDNSKPFYIGDDNASIIFDGNGHISINGNGITIGSNKTLTQVLAELGASIKTVEYGIGSSQSSHSDITTWSTDTPQWTSGSYVWMRTTTNGLNYTYTCIQGAKGDAGDDAIVLRVDSSAGLVFKNNAVSTILSVHILKSGEDITTSSRMRQVFGDSARIVWYYQGLNETTFHLLDPDDSMISNDGFILTLTPDRVRTKITFQCELDY